MTDDLNDLVTWLRAQLDEDERRAQRAKQTRSRYRLIEDPPSWEVAMQQALACTDTVDLAPAHAHMVHHDPARVLRDVEAKRRILDDILATPHFLDDSQYYGCEAIHHSHTDEDGAIFPEPNGRDLPTGRACTCGRDDAVNRRVRLLALPLVDLPGYRAEWRP